MGAWEELYARWRENLRKLRSGEGGREITEEEWNQVKDPKTRADLYPPLKGKTFFIPPKKNE